MSEIIYKELSYKLIGLAYQIQNKLGYGMKEATYKNAFEELLKQENIEYKREFYYPVKINNKLIAKKYFDFIIDEKIILEFKIGSDRYLDCYRQLLDYLKSSQYKLGIIIRLTKDGIKVKRIPNIY